MASRIVSDKRHNLFIDMVLNNKLYFQDNKIKVLFAGDGEYINFLKKRVKENNLQNLIIFNGQLEEYQLIKWFKKINIYMHLSKDETTSTSILQAMSMSLPIIASNIGGNKKLVKTIKGINNLILVKNNVNDLFKITKYIISNRSLQNKMSEVSRKMVVKYFSCERMFENYQKLF